MIFRILAVLFLASPVYSEDLPAAMLETFQDRLENNKYVVLVCVYRGAIEMRELPRKHRYHQKATVVRAIKGDWDIGAKLNFYSLIEDVSKELSDGDVIKEDVGVLKFMFLDKVTDSGGEFHLGVGDDWIYHPDLDAIALQH